VLRPLLRNEGECLDERIAPGGDDVRRGRENSHSCEERGREGGWEDVRVGGRKGKRDEEVKCVHSSTRKSRLDEKRKEHPHALDVS
jgi:hypothetical protein